MTSPDWLARHGGDLRLASDGRTWLAYFDGAPQYKLVPSPAAGRFACVVSQMDNGKRIDTGATFPTVDEALSGGLEGLRGKLGW